MADNASLLQVNETTAQIQRPWLRDAVTAISVLARPVGTMLCGVALAAVGFGIAHRACSLPLNEWDVAGLGVIAGGFGVAVWMKSRDKAAVTDAMGAS
jgi:hypothetical protein